MRVLIIFSQMNLVEDFWIAVNAPQNKEEETTSRSPPFDVQFNEHRDFLLCLTYPSRRQYGVLNFQKFTKEFYLKLQKAKQKCTFVDSQLIRLQCIHFLSCVVRRIINKTDTQSCFFWDNKNIQTDTQEPYISVA